jgi:hypothetical protein
MSTDQRTDAELLAELAPLAAVIGEKLRTVPVRHCPGGTDDLISELTIAAALYCAQHVLPAAAPTAPADPATALSTSERQFLTFALELAADQMASRSNEFDADDEAALAKLRSLTAEGAQP